MNDISEITIQELWSHLCALGIIELRINDRTVWADSALDVLFSKDYYNTIINDYTTAIDDFIKEQYSNFRVKTVNIKIVEGHHCIAMIEGYYK